MRVTKQKHAEQWSYEWFEHDPAEGRSDSRFVTAAITHIAVGTEQTVFTVHAHTYDGTHHRLYHAVVPDFTSATQFVHLIIAYLRKEHADAPNQPPAIA